MDVRDLRTDVRVQSIRATFRRKRHTLVNQQFQNEIITTGPAGNFVCGKQRFGRGNNRRDERGVPGLVHFSALTRFGVIETQSL